MSNIDLTKNCSKITLRVKEEKCVWRVVSLGTISGTVSSSILESLNTHTHTENSNLNILFIYIYI